jgi:hypothetical protein
LDSTEVQQLLKGESEFVMSANIERAHDLIEKEANLKLGAYFSVIDTESEIDLGGYTYGQFITLYRALLVKALYHRYFTRVNGGGGAVHFQAAQILEAAEADMPRVCAASILRDLVFDAEAAKQRTDPSYFSLFQEGADPRNIWMRPHRFAMSDGLVDHLRIVAHRRPQLFLGNVSDALGRGFARTVEETFGAEGFTCHANVSLREFGSNLPDIDLIAIAAEPTLGYVLFICELKGMIPAGWAKDRLRVLNEGGVAKAFAQIEAVNSFLRTDDGLGLIRKLLPAEGMPPFDGFVVVLRYLIITSSNAGMFFGNESIKVINFPMLKRLLKRADGDTQYILEVLKNYNEQIDGVLKRDMVEFQLGHRTVAYEVVTTGSLLDFPARKWRDSEERQQMIDDFIASGAHPFDTLKEHSSGEDDPS